MVKDLSVQLVISVHIIGIIKTFYSVEDTQRRGIKENPLIWSSIMEVSSQIDSTPAQSVADDDEFISSRSKRKIKKRERSPTKKNQSCPQSPSGNSPPKKKSSKTTEKASDTQNKPKQNTTSINLPQASPLNDEITPVRPPLIYIRNIQNFGKFCIDLESILGEDAFTAKATRQQVSILTNTPDNYRKAVKFLTETKADFHTYQLTTDKPFRVVIRHLHQSFEPETIKEALTKKGFEVKSVSPVLSRRLGDDQPRVPLPVFFVDLNPQATNNKEIYEMKTLLYTRVKVEDPYKTTALAQCHRCQEYHHTQGYCHHKPRCVKCAGPHLSAECTKPKEVPATCALCQGAHPANYKGCRVHLELQAKVRNQVTITQGKTNIQITQKSFPSLIAETRQNQQTNFPIKKRPLQEEPLHPTPALKKSFAEVVDRSVASSSVPSVPEVTNFQKSNESSQGHSSSQAPRSTTIGNQSNLVPTLSSFLADLQNFLKPYLPFLSTILNLLQMLPPTLNPSPTAI